MSQERHLGVCPVCDGKGGYIGPGWMRWLLGALGRKRL